jgi:hypothetical protein
MTTNRDTALNTVYPSANLAGNAVCRLYDSAEITFDEWLYATAVVELGGWMIHLGPIWKGEWKESN